MYDIESKMIGVDCFKICNIYLLSPASQLVILFKSTQVVGNISKRYMGNLLCCFVVGVVVVICSKKNPYSDMQLYLDKQVIERVSSAKFLGILISDSLSWSLYIDHICKKARRIIGFIHRAFSSAPICTRRILYLAIVSPILEYGSVTWHPLNTTLTNHLEACQRFAARVILQSWNLSHKDLLQKSNLPLLSKRRDYATLCHLYKILHHLSSSPNTYNPHPRPLLGNLNSRAVVPPFCRLTLCQKSFYPYAPTLWNYLPEDIIQCNSLQSFKSALRSHLG